MSAKKTHIVGRESWDWSLSNCALAKQYGMSPQAVRKSRIKIGKPAFKKPKKPKIYSDGNHLEGISLAQVDNSERRPASWRVRFWKYISNRGSKDCWIWNGRTRTQAGYGMLMVGILGQTRRFHLVHRLAYLLFHSEIPNGKLVRHKCDVKLCCNPAHLELGTDYDNVMDAVVRQGMNCGEKNGMSKTNRERRGDL